MTSRERSGSIARVESEELKGDLLRYLRVARETLLWKLDGVSEYDVRRPLVRTGTNLLGLVKHVATVEAFYLGDVFGRPFGEPLPWWEDGAEANADMWATPAESRDEIVDFYRRAWRHSDATVDALDLDAVGEVPWWQPDGSIPLHRMLVHVIAETNRHAGHADIVRELVDGSAGFKSDGGNLPALDDLAWSTHFELVDRAARQAARDVARS
jgi:uncharacterized damage-inducible protein DinB